MLTQLRIVVEPRLVVMIFKLFDRGNVNYFRFSNFEDIIQERIKPNFRKIVELERQKWELKLLRGETNHFDAQPVRRSTEVKHSYQQP